MTQFPSKEILEELDKALDKEQPLPNQDPVGQHIVNWHVFRRRESALKFAGNIMLEPGAMLVGGNTSDSVGKLWWVGVRVEDMEKWGQRSAMHINARMDPHNPGSSML
ncbi:MAG: hypothetical protein WCC36_02525 [Gammaproteobacteria bacterium]